MYCYLYSVCVLKRNCFYLAYTLTYLLTYLLGNALRIVDKPVILLIRFTYIAML